MSDTAFIEALGARILARGTPALTPLLPPIVLLGPPGAGKSTVAPRLAARLQRRLITLDDVAHAHRLADSAASTGTTGTTSAASLAAFRVREHGALKEALNGEPVLIDAGAGIVDVDANRDLLAGALCLHLTVPIDVALQRLSGPSRPWLPADDADRRTHYAAREAHRPALRAALAFATVHNAVNGPKATNDADDTLAALVAAIDGWSWQHLPKSAPHAAPFTEWPPQGWAVREGLAGHVVVVADANIAHQVGPPGVDIVFEATGSAKRLAAVESLLTSFARLGATRTTTIVAVGGGLTLDVVGLAASLYQRGLRWRAIPTTLLAMVDAAQGGKTAVDLDVDGQCVRNGAGSFWPATDTILSTRPLDSLSGDAIRHGRAEHVKHLMLLGRLNDDDLNLNLNLDGEATLAGDDRGLPTSAAILRSRALKAAVVAVDPNERHLRAALNLGHTLAHGLEALFAGQGATHELEHGDAVLHGLRLALWLSVRVAGLDAAWARAADDAVTALCPPALPPLTDDQLDRLMVAMGRDKKGPGRFVLLGAPGRPVLAQWRA